MSGIFGVFNRAGNKNIENLANRMESKLEHNEEWFSGQCIHHQSGFNGIVDFKFQLENDYVLQNGISIAIYGDIYSFGDLEIDSKYKAKKILALYEKKGLDFFKHLNGSFVISIYDVEKGEVIIANDRYGSKSLFYVINPDRILYSSEIKAILEDSLIKPKLNHESVVEFFTFSFILGNKSLFQGIELLPPASILIYDSKENKVQIDRYWDFEFNRNKEPKKLKNYLMEFDSLMEKAVEIRMADKDKIGIFLSGGVDSRLMAGFAKRVVDKSGKELISFTFGTKGGWQEKIAKQVADKLGIENRFYEIPADMIANYAEEVIYKEMGAIRIRNAHFISAFGKVRNEVDTVLVGAFCDTAFGAHLSSEVSNISSKGQLADYIFNRNKIELIAEHIPKVFTNTFLNKSAEMVKKNFMDTVKSEIPLGSYAEMVHYWDLRQRASRYILPLSSTRTSWYLNSRDPFLGNDILNFAINLPLKLKFGKEFIHKSLQYFFPHLAKIPTEHIGVSVDAGNLARKFFVAKRLTEARLKMIIERLSAGKILFTPKDYRAYDYWLRTGSRNFVEDVLSGVAQNIFNQAYVSKILKEHMTCQRNHDQLICDILNVQLLLKQFKI